MIKKLLILSIIFLSSCSSPQLAVRNIDLEKLINLHNETRAKWGYSYLHNSKSLDQYAQNHANFMLKKRKLRHSSVSNIMKLGYNNVGENIAWNQSDEEEVMNSWLWSPGHRANILSSQYDSIGCGVAYDEKNIYWCVVFGKQIN